MTDDDIRSMLAAKASEATVSDEAWQRIAARTAEPAPTRAGRRLAVAGAAVAAAAATVFVANVPGSPVSQVADDPTSTIAPAPAPATVDADVDRPHLFVPPTGSDRTIEGAARAFLRQLTDLDAGVGDVQLDPNGASGTVTYLGGVASQVFLERIGGRWVVDSAASDLVPVHDPVYEDGAFSATVVAEAAGDVRVDVSGVDGSLGEGAPSHTGPVAVREEIPIRGRFDDRYVRFAAVLRTEGGTTAVSGGWASDHAEVDPAVPTGPIASVWPAVDANGMAQLQADADEGLRPDLLDPLGVAGGYLAELLPRDRSAQHFALREFQQGDQTSGEVPYGIDGEPVGEVLLRRTGPGAIWVVAGVSSDRLRLDARRDGAGDIVVDVAEDAVDRYEAVARTPGGGAVRAAGVGPGAVTLEGTARSRWVQVVGYRADRVVAVRVVPLP